MNPYDTIKKGDEVTIIMTIGHTPSGSPITMTETGIADRQAPGCWLLYMKTHDGNPVIATKDNVIKVKHKKGA